MGHASAERRGSRHPPLNQRHLARPERPGVSQGDRTVDLAGVGAFTTGGLSCGVVGALRLLTAVVARRLCEQPGLVTEVVVDLGAMVWVTFTVSTTSNSTRCVS